MRIQGRIAKLGDTFFIQAWIDGKSVNLDIVPYGTEPSRYYAGQEVTFEARLDGADGKLKAHEVEP